MQFGPLVFHNGNGLSRMKRIGTSDLGGNPISGSLPVERQRSVYGLV
jgi:hypothetical protein